MKRDGMLYEEHALAVLIGTTVGLVIGGLAASVWLALVELVGRRRG